MKLCCFFNHCPFYRFPIYSAIDKEFDAEFYFNDCIEFGSKPFDVNQLKGFKSFVHGYFTKLKKGYEADTLTAVVVRCVIICVVVLFYTYKLALSQGIPMNLVWVMLVVLIYNFITSKTTIGRYFYTIGGNVEATRLSGIDTKRIYFLAYLNMQFLTVIAAWMTLARQTSAAGSNGTNFEMDAISACVVGGVSAYGGSGTVFGMVVGATLIGVINMGMNLMGIDANWQKVVKGLVLLAAVVFEILNNKDKTKA